MTGLALIQHEADAIDYCQKYNLNEHKTIIPVPFSQTDDKLEIMKDHLSCNLNGKRVLDIGANKGFFTVYTASRGASVTAVEPFPRNADLIRKIAGYFKLNNIEVINSKFNAALLKLGKFDIIILGSCYHYLYDDLKGHDNVFSIIAQLSNGILLFEGPLTMDDEYLFKYAKDAHWSEEYIESFTKFKILDTAAKYFTTISCLGKTKYTPDRFVYLLTK